jgi:hypothetical protein
MAGSNGSGAAGSRAARGNRSQSTATGGIGWTWVWIGVAFSCGVIAAWIGQNPASLTAAPNVHVHSAPTKAEPLPADSAAPQQPATAASTKASTPKSGSAPLSGAGSDEVIDRFLQRALDRVGRPHAHGDHSHAENEDSELESSPVLSRGGRMIMAWQTPVYRVNIASFGRSKSSAKGFDLQSFNRAIATRVLHYFRAVQNRYAAAAGPDAPLIFDSSDAHNANQIFYEW